MIEMDQKNMINDTIMMYIIIDIRFWFNYICRFKINSILVHYITRCMISTSQVCYKYKV